MSLKVRVLGFIVLGAVSGIKLHQEGLYTWFDYGERPNHNISNNDSMTKKQPPVSSNCKNIKRRPPLLP